MSPRKHTDLVWEMMDEGLVNPLEIARACLLYMSDDEVADMLRINDLLLSEDEEDEEDAPLKAEHLNHPDLKDKILFLRPKK